MAGGCAGACLSHDGQASRNTPSVISTVGEGAGQAAGQGLSILKVTSHAAFHCARVSDLMIEPPGFP